MGIRNIEHFIQNMYKGGKHYKSKNDEVFENCLYYHNNKIAWIEQGDLWISSCNWMTLTTKGRLNQLSGVHIIQKNYTWYLNGKEWDGKPVKVKDFK